MSEPATRPIPEVTEELRPFYEAAREGRLAVQRCPDCGTLRFPPRPICSRCLGRASEWTTVSGRGEIFSFNVMHQVYHPGFAREVPYPVVLVELEEGCRVLSNVVDCPRERLRIGLAVEVVFEKVNEEVTLPKFRPRGNR
ncbi:MAG: Zn-ribbon domain-containing OB-fold protein [Candidatus Binatia bacterium]